MSTIGDRLKFLRTTSGLNQEDFGKQFGIVKSTVSLYENGKSTPDDQTKLKICQHYNVSMDWLYGLENVSNVKKSNDESVFFFDFGFSNRFSSLLEKSHITIEMLSEKTGLPLNQIDNLKKGHPELKALIVLADFFNVSIDYLLCRSSIPKISADEEDLIASYKKCSIECQRYLKAKAEVLSIEGISAVTTSNYSSPRNNEFVSEDSLKTTHKQAK